MIESVKPTTAYLRVTVIGTGIALTVIGIILLVTDESAPINVVLSGLMTGSGVTLGISEMYLASRKRMHSEILQRFTDAKSKLQDIAAQNTQLNEEFDRLRNVDEALRASQTKLTLLHYRAAYEIGAYSIFIPLVPKPEIRTHILSMMKPAAEALDLQDSLKSAMNTHDFMDLTRVLEFGITERYDSLVRGAFRLGVLVSSLKNIIPALKRDGPAGSVDPSEYAADVSGLMEFIGVDRSIADYSRRSIPRLWDASTAYNDKVRFLYALDYYLKTYGLDWDYDNARLVKEFMSASNDLGSAQFRSQADEILRRFDVPLEDLYTKGSGDGFD